MALVMLAPVNGPYARDLIDEVVEPMNSIEVRPKKCKRASGGSTKSVKTPLGMTFDTFDTLSPGPFEKNYRSQPPAPRAGDLLWETKGASGSLPVEA